MTRVWSVVLIGIVLQVLASRMKLRHHLVCTRYSAVCLFVSGLERGEGVG
jgi:hypothetical protein